ncbi:MAG: hypothetical protein GX329_03435 [Tissierellia bacterium]|nr:hypothetical protein [Tissierellia bacterium]
MVLVKVDLYKMYEALQYKFLYKNDINSIHILLNLYDLEDNMANIYPKYISTRAIRKRINRQLIYKKDREFISNNISLLLHEDIDRLELIVYLEGYKNGYHNIKWANILEGKSIKHFSIETVYEKNFLFHYDIHLEEIRNFREYTENEIRDQERESKFLNNFIITYCNKVIKKKVYNLNRYMDKQLTIEFEHGRMNIREEPLLTTMELNRMYEIIVDTIIKNVVNIYLEANWLGINDRVLNRYS